MNQNKNIKQKGFTLIELLIVVAIIAILAAIAIPNFLAAQVRSKVSRTLGEFRTLATGLEAYYVDHNDYPATREGQRMTTPIAYITSFPRSPWREFYGWASTPEFTTINHTYLYVSSNTWGTLGNNPFDIMRDYFVYIGPAMGVLDPAQVSTQRVRWGLKSVGPDGADNVFTQGFNARLYDPTNGTVSLGDIVWFNDGTGSGRGVGR